MPGTSEHVHFVYCALSIALQKSKTEDLSPEKATKWVDMSVGGLTQDDIVVSQSVLLTRFA